MKQKQIYATSPQNTHTSVYSIKTPNDVPLHVGEKSRYLHQINGIRILHLSLRPKPSEIEPNPELLTGRTMLDENVHPS